MKAKTFTVTSQSVKNQNSNLRKKTHFFYLKSTKDCSCQLLLGPILHRWMVLVYMCMRGGHLGAYVYICMHVCERGCEQAIQ